jgi:toxin secretion/phage lysis holin
MEAPNRVLEIKAAIVAALAAGTALFGSLGWAIMIWAACMLLDYMTGTWAAMAAGQWSSAVARTGLWHKLGEVVAVLVAALCDLALGVLAEGLHLALPQFSAVLPIVLLWYIFTELGSVAENAAALGAPLPKWLVAVIAKCRSAADEPLLTEEEEKETKV